MSSSSDKPVGAALNTVRILDLISDADRPMRLVDVVATLDINGSTCLNLLRTLAAEDWLRFDARDKSYAPGPMLIAVGYRALHRSHDLGRIMPHLDALAHRHGITVMLWKIEGDHLAAVASVSPRSVLNIRTQTGRSVPLLTGSMGRIAAFALPLSEAERRAEYDRAGWPADFPYADFLREAEESRARGWSVEHALFRRGVNALSVPVFAPGGRVDRILSAYAVAEDLPEDREQQVAADMVEAANAIALGL